MVCYALKRHKDLDVPLEVKLEQKPCRKENFNGKWRMIVYNWIKVNLLYYSSIKQAFQCFLQLGDVF